MSVSRAWPARSGHWTTYTDPFPDSCHTASVLCGKNDGGPPSSLSYQASAAAKSRTGIPANS
jgi:hypothetical protein